MEVYKLVTILVFACIIMAGVLAYVYNRKIEGPFPDDASVDAYVRTRLEPENADIVMAVYYVIRSEDSDLEPIDALDIAVREVAARLIEKDGE